MLSSALAALVSLAGPLPPRFEPRAPLASLPPVMIDMRQDGIGLAQQVARSRQLQGRMLWIDCTANIERYNTEEKIVALVEQIAKVGFNTIVFDVKPISGQVIYPSRFAPKLTEWRGRLLPESFDPVPIMVREAKARGLQIFASLNAFSEGHRMFLVGPGYARPDQQTVLYETEPTVRTGALRYDLGPRLNQPAEGKISVYSTATWKPEEGMFVVTLDRLNRVVDGFLNGGMAKELPTIPRGGTALVGRGAAADWLRRATTPGAKVFFETRPVFVKISERPEQQIPLMMNPNDPRVVQYAVEVAKEVAANYAFDGILYDDRLRYGGINADFSESTRAQFEARVGRKLQWPDDVFRFTVTNRLERGVLPGRYYEDWMVFRAQTLTDFMRRVRSEIVPLRPKMQLGVYAGSWYGEYASFGSNYASPEFDAGFWYTSNAYRTTGYAGDIDLLVTGCYYPTATIHEALAEAKPIGPTVESAGHLSNRAARDLTWTYAGIALSDFKDDPEGLMSALQAAVASTQGVMVFDLSHDIDPMWKVFAQAFAQPRKAPSSRPDLLAAVRAQRRSLDARGVRPPAVIISAGTAGAGH